MCMPKMCEDLAKSQEMLKEYGTMCMPTWQRAAPFQTQGFWKICQAEVQESRAPGEEGFTRFERFKAGASSSCSSSSSSSESEVTSSSCSVRSLTV